MVCVPFIALTSINTHSTPILQRSANKIQTNARYTGILYSIRHDPDVFLIGVHHVTTARSQQIHPDITPYYHCVSRCVRRSFLCGEDSFTGQSYEHRRAWIEERILTLSTVYCIDVCAYAVMSNHYHIVVHIDKKKAKDLSDHEVIERWCSEHNSPSIIKKFKSHQIMTDTEKLVCSEIITIWRERLSSISWFMKELNHGIAVQANKEDQCTGRFWEGRFKSQALLDEKALLAAMAYVDLNPVRANTAKLPETSEHTSLKYRLDSLKLSQKQPIALLPFASDLNEKSSHSIPFSFVDYLELVDWIGRQIREDKQGHIEKTEPKILQRLTLSHKEYYCVCTALESKPRLWIGTSDKIVNAKTKLERQRMVALVIA